MTKIVLVEALTNDGDVLRSYVENPDVIAWYNSQNYLPIPDTVIAAVRANPEGDYYDDGTAGCWPEEEVREEMESYIEWREPQSILMAAGRHYRSQSELQELLQAHPDWKIIAEVSYQRS